MFFQIHLAVESDADDFKLTLAGMLGNAKLNFKECAYLCKVMKLWANAFAKLHKFVFGQDFASIKVWRELLTVSVNKDLNDLKELVLDDDSIVLGKDIKNVANQHVLIVTFFCQDAHDCYKRVPLEVFLDHIK